MTRRAVARAAVAIAAAIATGVPAAPATPEGAIGLVSIADVFARIGSARTVTLAAYSLKPHAIITTTLVAAADRGARVSVALGRDAFGDAQRDNAETAALLGAHRIEVHASPATSHIKVAIIDGALYLTDRNFASRSAEGIVVLDTIAGDRVLVERALLGSAGGNDHLWTRKADALAAEARVIGARASRSVAVSTESFGGSTPVFDALLARRRAGDEVRLLVAASEYRTSPIERHAVDALRGAGVQVRLSDANEKYAVDGDAVWIGSANATRGRAEQIDFGIAMRDAGLAGALANQFNAEYARATE